MRNEDVVHRFVRDRDTNNDGHSVSSSGDVLYSYNARIAEWDGDTLLVHDGWDGYSTTTSKHFKFLHDAVEESDVRWEATHEPSGKGKHKPRWH